MCMSEVVPNGDTIFNKVERMRSDKSKLRPDDHVQLPLWGSEGRGLPNALARCGLFSARRDESENEAREYLPGVEIPALSNYRINYRGEELRQDDSAVFMQLVHLAREQPLGSRVSFTAHSFLKDIGWATNGEAYSRLRACFERLKANYIQISTKDNSGGYAKSLIRAFYWQNDQGETLQYWSIELEPDIIKLYGDTTYTVIQWRQRKMIGTRAVLALWLHSFLATHFDPMPISVEKYKELSRSRCKTLFHFKAQLKTALERLIEVGFLDSYQITDKNLVVLTRSRLKPLPATVTTA